MNKKSILMCCLTLLMVAYMGFALPLTSRMASHDTLRGIDIVMTNGQTRFISAADVAFECGIDEDTITRICRSSFDLNGLERRLASSDKVETVNANILTNGHLRICITPMEPVARVFDGDASYYINGVGKKMSAELRYHIDVPVVVGHFDSLHPAERLLPLLHYIATDSAAKAIVGTVAQDRGGDIILVPRIVGHVVNFGDTSATVDKFARLLCFYKEVMPTVGWNHYDTLTVKWAGQVVATRRNKAVPQPELMIIEEQTGVYDLPDDGTMQVPDSTDYSDEPEPTEEPA